jgi:hypothetical protein
MHVCAVPKDDRLMHTIRRADGSWLPWGDVEGQTGDIGQVQRVAASATVNGELHVCAVTQDGRLTHTIRRADGSWLKFGDVEGQASDIGKVAHVAVSETASGELHVCAVGLDPLTSASRLMHTIRRADGSWSPWGDVEAQTAPIGGGPGKWVAVAASATVNGLLHVCAVRSDLSGLTSQLLHIRRRADGSWSNFVNVEGPGQAGPAGPAPGRVRRVAASATATGELHVCALGFNFLKHTIRRTDGSWFPFGDVMAQAGEFEASGDDVAASMAVNGELHVCAVAKLSGNATRLNHTIRRADGSWFPFGDVETQTGDIGKAGSNSGEFASVAISGR